MTRIRLLIVVAIGVPTGWGLGRFASNANVAPELDPMTESGLVVSPSSLELGEVSENPAYEHRLPVANRSSADISIKGFTQSCSCLSVVPDSLTIPPGATAEFRLTLDLAGAGRSSTSATRDYDVDIAPRLAGNTASPTWHIHAKVVSVLDFPAKVIQLGEKELRASDRSSPIVTIIRSKVPLGSLTSECDPAYALTRTYKLPPEDDLYALKIYPTKRLEVGVVQFTVSVTAKDSAGRILQTLPIPVTARLRDEVVAMPAQVCMTGNLGEFREDYITLQSKNNSPFKVERIAGADDNVLVTSIGANSNLVARYRIRRHIAHPGSSLDKLVFYVRLLDERMIEIPIEVTSYGIQTAR